MLAGEMLLLWTGEWSLRGETLVKAVSVVGDSCLVETGRGLSKTDFGPF